MFSRYTPRNTKHSLYTFQISCKFCVLLMLRKIKPQNPLTSRVNADLGAKCCNVKSKRRGAKYPAIHFLFFAFRDRFHVFRDKCILGLTIFSFLLTVMMRYVSVKIMTVLSSYVCCEMCTVIIFYTTLNQSAMEIHQQILSVYSETCMLIQMIHRWMKYYWGWGAET